MTTTPLNKSFFGNTSVYTQCDLFNTVDFDLIYICCIPVTGFLLITILLVLGPTTITDVLGDIARGIIKPVSDYVDSIIFPILDAIKKLIDAIKGLFKPKPTPDPVADPVTEPEIEKKEIENPD